MKNPYIIGIQAEQRALDYLMAKGFILLKRRYKTPYGEIDLLMQWAEVFVAIEVKFRSHMTDSLYAIDDNQKSRIQNALAFYLQQTHNACIEDVSCRFDVVLMARNTGDVMHIENAW
jgi:putative endonuclease